MENKCWFCYDTPGLEKWGYDFSRIQVDDSFGDVNFCFPGFPHRDNSFGGDKALKFCPVCGKKLTSWNFKSEDERKMSWDFTHW